ncbi:MAG TPA: prephenate dehydratase [Spirochaetota bacterium]|nr:prephenate dehydratase [Spirochaetota bacterium]HPJ37139.1 prephenate dehydratase [Spirochaetota bacterium]HPQ53289.1 prephenate dehydratase [Spirochaetota bacterium]
MDTKINELDKRIIELISERSKLYIDSLKRREADTSVVFSPLDQQEVQSVIEQVNNGPVSNVVMKRVFGEIISNAANAVKPVKVAYLGPEGTFTHAAMLEIFGSSIVASTQKTIPDVFQEVEAGNALFGVVPVENSTEGAVTYTLDELLDTDMKIVSEKFLRISHSLVTLCDNMKKIKKLYSHPQPLGQCKIWLRNNLPDVETHVVTSTSIAAETASWDKFSAAIASEISAQLYGLNVLESNIEDSKNNYTRFLVISKTDNPPTGHDKTSIVCAVKDKPGALYDMLKPFHEAGINMSKIESRPDKKKMWEYNFFIDFGGHKDDTVVRDALERMKENTIFLKILGSYPVGN